MKHLCSLALCAFLSAQVANAQSDAHAANQIAVSEMAWPYPALPSFAQTRSWRVRRMEGQSSTSVFSIILLPKAHFSVSIVPVLKEGAAKDVFKGSHCPGSILSINGGFYSRPDSGPTPLGLLVSSETVRFPSSGRKFGGFLISDGNSVAVIPRSQGARAERSKFALESSPIIVEDGRDGMRSDDHAMFDRVAIGSTADGDTAIALALGKDQDTVSLAEFSKLVLSESKTMNIHIDNMIAMDGGPSSHLYFPESEKLFGDPGAVYLPDEICFFRR